MYTIQENVRIVIALLKQYGVRHIVVNPGGTNIPISHAVQDDDFFKCYSIPDERSAMYFAIGLHLQTGEIIATTCTSAQATRNYVPGLTEAFYKHTPILAITTSKLERFEYQDYMQAPVQCSLPTDAVKKSFDLPPITDENTRMQVIHSAKEAILEVTHRTPGPVQLNIRINDSVQSQFVDSSLPIIPQLKRYMAWDSWNDFELTNKRILIVVGEHRPFNDIELSAIESFCETHNAAVYVNHLSNYAGKYRVQANLLAAVGGFSDLRPDILITIGGQTGDYSIFYALQSKGIEHWRVAIDGDYVDTYNSLTKIFECPDYFFFSRLKGVVPSGHTYYNSLENQNERLNYLVDVPFSNLYVAQSLYKLIPANSIMNFAILNSLRCWNYFPIDKRIQCYANVSAFGIDGCNSMLFGESMNTDQLCFIVTGDLAFFYDMNALGIRHIKNNVRIILINNNGGAEFKIMTKSWKENIATDKFISANGHNGNARGWAENCGYRYLMASTKEEFTEIHSLLIQPSEKPILCELFTTQENDAEAIDCFLKTNVDTIPIKDMKGLLRSLKKKLL